MTRPLVTVLMAVLNGEPWLPTSVPDVLGQTMGDLELLLVDDGSTDRTRELLASFEDPRIRVETLEHVGLARALNRGLELASGRYVARMDVDDRSCPARLEQQLAAAGGDPAVLAVGCTFEVLDEQGRQQSMIAPPTHDDDIRRRLLVRNPFAAGSMLFDADALRAVGGFREQYTAAEDYDILIRLARKGRLTSAPDALYGWRVHASNMSLRLRERELRTVAELHDRLWREMPQPRRARELSARLAEYADGIPGMGETVAAQLLQTEILIGRAMLRRGRRQAAARQLLAVAAVGPDQWRYLVRDIPGRISRAFGQRARTRRAAA